MILNVDLGILFGWELYCDDVIVFFDLFGGDVLVVFGGYFFGVVMCVLVVVKWFDFVC